MITISKKDFITDDKNNTVCFSSLLPTESSGLSPKLRKELNGALMMGKRLHAYTINTRFVLELYI